MEVLRETIRSIALCGDSILKGIQWDGQRYRVQNTMDFSALEQRTGCRVENFSRFGCTVTKGRELIERALGMGKLGDTVVMDFGGNDCDFDWAAVAADPTAEHQPKILLEEFVSGYRSLIRLLKEHAVRPILCTLPPLQPEWFFQWFCEPVGGERVLSWLGNISAIYRFQENYSRAVERLAREEQVQLVDLRGAFLENRRVEQLLCRDGIHPNSAGQKLIAQAVCAAV